MLIPTNKDDKGFTILEVLIVLSIAGLITVMVFLAIPALQRTGRNNQRTQDVAAILAAISRYQLNNSGNFPPSATFNIDVLEKAKRTHYVYSNSVEVNSITYGNTAPPNTTDATTRDVITIHNRAKCEQDGGQPTSAGAGYSDVVALYSIEASGGSAKKCKEM